MPSFRPADLSLPCSPSCVGPNGLTERLTQGASGTPVHRRECLTILLGTYAENGQCNRPTTNCIVFGTACLRLHSGSRLCCRSHARSTIALERRGALIHQPSLDVDMYFTKLTQDMGVLEQRRKLSCMAYPFRLLR